MRRPSGPSHLGGAWGDPSTQPLSIGELAGNDRAGAGPPGGGYPRAEAQFFGERIEQGDGLSVLGIAHEGEELLSNPR